MIQNIVASSCMGGCIEKLDALLPTQLHVTALGLSVSMTYSRQQWYIPGKKLAGAHEL